MPLVLKEIEAKTEDPGERETVSKILQMKELSLSEFLSYRGEITVASRQKKNSRKEYNTARRSLQCFSKSSFFYFLNKRYRMKLKKLVGKYSQDKAAKKPKSAIRRFIA
jgi:hypothetical protein